MKILEQAATVSQKQESLAHNSGKCCVSRVFYDCADALPKGLHQEGRVPEVGGLRVM